MTGAGPPARGAGGMAHYDVLIVGAGHAGAQAAIALRQQGFAGSVGVIGEEPGLPYERPPLTKDYLAGARTAERLLIRPPAFWRERDVSFILGARVASVDPAGKVVATAAGERFGYRHLIWAAGGRPRRLTCDGHDLAGVHAVRTVADVDRMIAELPDTATVAVIGGGYIGLEAAAILSALGKSVIIFEAQDRVLARVAGAALSRFYEAEHRAHGVDIWLNAQVLCIEGERGRVSAVRLRDGERMACDMVVVGIGIDPSVEPLIEAGARGGDGVSIDAFTRTSLPDVFAIGDCASHANAFADGMTLRLESVQNAADMAATAAAAILGRAEPYSAVPWFWSNQYDLKLQTIGLSIGYDATVTRGDPATRSFSVIYLRQGVVVALDCVNAVRDYVQGRLLVKARHAADPERLRSAASLKDVAAGRWSVASSETAPAAAT